MTQVDKGLYKPLIIAAGGGGRGYSSQSESQMEHMDYDPSQPGRNGKSHAAGRVHTAMIRDSSSCMCAATVMYTAVYCSITLSVQWMWMRHWDHDGWEEMSITPTTTLKCLCLIFPNLRMRHAVCFLFPSSCNHNQSPGLQIAWSSSVHLHVCLYLLAYPFILKDLPLSLCINVTGSPLYEFIVW